MKNLADVHTRLKAELDQWFIKQSHNLYADYYLWYQETTTEHNGGFIIAEDPPVNKSYQLACPIRKGMTVEQNFTVCDPILRRLPILTV